MKSKPVYSLPIDRVFQYCQTTPDGLSGKEARHRLQVYGPNRLPAAEKLPVLKLLLSQFKNPLIYILIAAFFISLASQHLIDAVIIAAVVLISGLVGFIQEYKTDELLIRLQQLVSYKARVYRDGQEMILPHEDLVPGDLIVLAAGEKIPADARLIETYDLEVIEAALTGESVPSAKTPRAVLINTPLSDRENMVYLGTVVARGKARAVVTGTGSQTEIGKIALLAKETEGVQTPLQHELVKFGRTLGLLLIGINAFIFFLGVLAGKAPLEMFLTSVAVIVAATPEGLLPALTIILAIGMQNLARHKGLVRKMLAAEALGSVSVICVDKTGTVTQGEMRVSQVITQTAEFTFPLAYPSGTESLSTAAGVLTALKIGLSCSNAVVENPGDEPEKWVVNGDHTEKALVVAGWRFGLLKHELGKKEPRLAEIPFDSKFKYMATLNRANPDLNQTEVKDSSYVTYVKGAPERVLALSSKFELDGQPEALSELKKQAIEKRYEDLSRAGLRVLAVAYKKEIRNHQLPSRFRRDNLTDLVFVGLIVLKDPLRSEAWEMVRQSRRAGIGFKIISGDHKLTTMAVAADLGLAVGPENVLTGPELAHLSEAELMDRIDRVTVFARVEPKDKIRIVSALQARGEVVAMTGDGVNDALALKRADIGITVGSGTDVAKEVADLVLLDDNFATITAAVKRGRIIFNNIRKVMIYLLSDSFTETFLIAGSVLLGFPLPVLPAQILWIKLIEDTSPAVALAFEEIDEEVMAEPPRPRNESLLGPKLLSLIVFFGIVMDLLLFSIFYFYWKSTGNLSYARTIAFVGLGFASLFNIYAVRGLKRSILKLNPFANPLLNLTTLLGLVLFLVAVYGPFAKHVLKTVPLGLSDWMVLTGYGLVSIVVYEVGKKLTIARS